MILAVLTTFWPPCHIVKSTSDTIMERVKIINILLNKFHKSIKISNGKSSIVEERLYSFFFAFFPQKNEVSYFRFFSSTQLLTKTFVLLRSCKILKSFTSFCFVFTNFWIIPIRFTIDFEKIGLILFASLCCSKILEQPGSFRFDLQNKEQGVRFVFDLTIYFGLDSFLLQFWQVEG